MRDYVTIEETKTVRYAKGQVLVFAENPFILIASQVTKMGLLVKASDFILVLNELLKIYNSFRSKSYVSLITDKEIEEVLTIDAVAKTMFLLRKRIRIFRMNGTSRETNVLNFPYTATSVLLCPNIEEKDGKFYNINKINDEKTREYLVKDKLLIELGCLLAMDMCGDPDDAPESFKIVFEKTYHCKKEYVKQGDFSIIFAVCYSMAMLIGSELVNNSELYNKMGMVEKDIIIDYFDNLKNDKTNKTRAEKEHLDWIMKSVGVTESSAKFMIDQNIEPGLLADEKVRIKVCGMNTIISYICKKGYCVYKLEPFENSEINKYLIKSGKEEYIVVHDYNLLNHGDNRYYMYKINELPVRYYDINKIIGCFDRANYKNNLLAFGNTQNEFLYGKNKYGKNTIWVNENGEKMSFPYLNEMSQFSESNL